MTLGARATCTGTPGTAPETRPLRIAMISYYLPSGSKIGVGYWVDQLARELIRRGNQVTVYSACPAVEGAPYDVVTVALAGPMRTFRFAVALRGVDLSSFDVLHAHGDDYWLWRRRTPAHVRTMHGTCFAEALRIPGAREKVRMVALGVGELLATVVADRTFVVSPETRRWMPWVRGVLPAGVDLRRFARPDGLPRAGVPTILFVGTYGQRKRGRLLMEAFEREVRPRVPDAQLWMVAEDAPAAPGVQVLGRVSDERLVELYHRAWLFCLPSSYEGLGIPYVEAMASGLPVVATSNPGSRYVLEDGRYGVILDEDALGSTLAGLLEDRERREGLERAALRRSSELSLDAVVDAYLGAYRALLALRAPDTSASAGDR